MRKMFTGAAAAALLLLPACDSDKPVETVIYGTVLDAQTGQPLQGIPYQMSIVLGGPGSLQILDKGLTDSNGHFIAKTSFYSSSGTGVDFSVNLNEQRNESYGVYSKGVQYGTHTLTFRLERKTP